MDLDFVPLLRLPFTDMGACMVSHQQFGYCAKAEMRAMSCLEAYGVHRGKEKCKDLLSDYRECFMNRTQVKRVKYMRFVRQTQFLSGKRDKLWAEDPKSTSF